MGQINLFASTLTPVMRDFLVNYMSGDLHPVAMVRVLDEHPYPQASIVCAKLAYNYALVEVSDPLQWRDVDWLYRCVVQKEFEFDRWSAKRYSIDRALNLPSGQHGRRHIENDAQWAKINEFRRQLELPALLFKHLNQTYTNGDHMDVQRLDHILLVEYEGEIIPTRPRRPITQDAST